MRRSRQRISSSCGGRTRAPLIPSSFTMCSKAFTTALVCIASTLAVPKPRIGPTFGSGSTLVPTSLSRTAWPRSSSTTALSTATSSLGPRPGTRSTRPASLTGRLDERAQITGIPEDVIEEMAIAYAKAPSAQICWTLGITEHHNGTDNVLALINLSLLTGHVGRYGSGLVPIRGQNNVQGGGDMGALPNKLPGFQDVEDPQLRAKFEATYGVQLNPKRGWHLTQMFEAMEAGHLRALYVIGENPAQSEADVANTRKALEGLDFLVVQDMFLTKTAAMADVVFPAAADWVESEGTVTSSERRVQRVRKALEPPGEAKTDIEILHLMAARLGQDWGMPSAEELWDELRSLSPPHAGMAYGRLEDLGGIQWPCYDEDHPGEQFLHSRLWSDDVGRRAPFSPVEDVPPADSLSDDFPFRMTTGRQLDSYNTGVQSGGFDSPQRRGGVLEISSSDAADLGLLDGDLVKVSSRRGHVEVPVRITASLRPGLMFMPVHFPDELDVNLLTIDAWDKKSGTADFKATAVNVQKSSV